MSIFEKPTDDRSYWMITTEQNKTYYDNEESYSAWKLACESINKDNDVIKDIYIIFRSHKELVLTSPEAVYFAGGFVSLLGSSNHISTYIFCEYNKEKNLLVGNSWKLPELIQVEHINRPRKNELIFYAREKQ